MSTFSRVMDILGPPVDALTESQFNDRVVLEVVKAINKDRRNAGAPPLHIDEYCNKAASEIASKISQLGNAVSSCGVIGSDFSMINSEKNHQFPTSARMNEVVLTAYLSQLSMLDMSSRRSLNNPQYTHCGFAVKRVYDMLKLHGVLFKKALCVFHVSFDVTNGIQIRGKMLDHGYALCAVVVRDVSQTSGKPTIAGPSRMKFSHDTLEFEVKIPRLILSSRAVADKELEFYVTPDNTRTIAYGKMPDINEIAPGATVAHKMTFNGLWESNVMIEDRNPADSQFVRDEHESKNASQLMEFDMGGPRRGTATRARGPALRGRGTRTSAWGTGNRDTPFKSTHLGLRRTTNPPAWGPPADPPYGENVPPTDVEMSGAQGDQHQVGFFPPATSTPAPPAYPQAPAFPTPAQAFPTAAPAFPPPAPTFPQQFPAYPQPQPAFQFPTQNPFASAQYSTFQPPTVYQQAFQQPMYPGQNPVQSPTDFLIPQQPMPGMQLVIPYSVPSAPNYFGRPAGETVFGLPGSHSSLGSTLPPPPKVQKCAQTSTDDRESERDEGIVRDEDSVLIPCLLIPMPVKLFEVVRRGRQENEGTRSLWTSMDYSDVILKLKDCELKSHRGVLSSGSPFFKEHLEKVKAFGAAPVAKLVMPHWIAEKPMKLVLMFMYSCDIDKERLDLAAAREVLALADFLGVHELVVCIIVKHIILKLTKEDVLSIMKTAFQRGSEQTKDAWTFLGDYCAQFAAENVNWLLRNKKTEFQGVPLPLLFKMVEAALRLYAASDTVTMLITLLIEAGLAQDIFELCNKVSALSLLGYSDSLVDIRMVDLLRPYEPEHFEKLPPDQVMEFATFKENDLHFQTIVRNAPVPPPALGEVNVCSVPIDMQAVDSKMIGYKQTLKSLPLVQPSDLRANRKKPQFSFTISELNRPRTIVSPVFSTPLRSWFLTAILSEDALSLFLCERGKGLQDTPEDLMYTSVACEIAMESAAHQQVLAFFYCFPNGHAHCAGERNACKLAKLGDVTKLTLHVCIREFPVHSAIVQYLAERFDTFNDKKYRHFKPLSFYDFRAILAHDGLKVKDERPCVAALWKYAAVKDVSLINPVIPTIRFQFLSVEDLCSMARDHVIIRQCENFRHLFETEFYRRLKSGPVTEKPRNSYIAKAHSITTVNHCDALLKWLLNANHHEGYDRKLEQEQKRFEEEKADFERKRAELNARKHELFIENEKLHNEVKRMKKDFGDSAWEEESRHHDRDYSEMRTPLSERSMNRQNGDCSVM